MKIQRQCHNLADALTDAVRDDLRGRVELYCKEHGKSALSELPEKKLKVDKKRRIITLEGGAISGDLKNTGKCLVGEGVNVVIGEGSIVLGCVFSRLDLASMYDPEVKEIHETHKIVIGRNCVLIGCLFRDDVTIGDNSVMAASAASQVTIGRGARVFLSSVLARYGILGERFTAIQTLFHTDKCEVGADTFMCSGKWGIIPWGYAYDGLYDTITAICDKAASNVSTYRFLKDTFLHGFRDHDRAVKAAERYKNNPVETDYEGKYASPTVYRKQYLKLDDLAEQFDLCKGIVKFPDSDITLERATFNPLVVVLRNYIQDTRSRMEIENADGKKYTFREAFSFSPRIHIGNNLHVFTNFLLGVSRIEQKEEYARNRWAGRRLKPSGFDNFTWEKFNGKDYDLEIGDDCTITTTADWVEGKPVHKYAYAGRFVMRDNVTLYQPGEAYGDISLHKSLQTVDIIAERTCQDRLSVRTEYLFDEGSKVFIRGVVNSNATYKPCYVWRVSVRRNDLAVI